MATGKAIIYKGIPYFSDVKVPTRVSQLANDAGYVTTDEKVKQTSNTTSMDSHPILFSASDSSGEVVGGTYKNPDFYYNPNLNRMIFKNGGGIEVRYGTASVSVLSQYILLSDLDDHSIMNITANDIELADVTSQGTTYSNTWDGTHHSLKTTVSSLKQSLSNYIKIKSIVVLKDDAARNMSLSPYVSVDSGYKFLCWLVSGASNGWITSMPIYISAPGDVRGFPFWHPNLTIGGAINFYYLEIKDV